MMYNSHKTNDYVIIKISNILWEINYQIPYQLLLQICYNTAIINSHSQWYIIVVRKNFCNSYYSSMWLFTNMFLFCFQTKNSDMYAYLYSWHSHDANKNQQNNELLSLFFYDTFSYWLKNLLIAVTFLCWQVFLGGWKQTNKIINIEVLIKPFYID